MVRFSGFRVKTLLTAPSPELPYRIGRILTCTCQSTHEPCGRASRVTHRSPTTARLAGGPGYAANGGGPRRRGAPLVSSKFPKWLDRMLSGSLNHAFRTATTTLGPWSSGRPPPAFRRVEACTGTTQSNARPCGQAIRDLRLEHFFRIHGRVGGRTARGASRGRCTRNLVVERQKGSLPSQQYISEAARPTF